MMRTNKRPVDAALLVFVVGALVPACDSNEVGAGVAVDTPFDAGFTDGGTEDGGVDPLAYPVGPYGVGTGDVIENFRFAGFFSSSSTTGPANVYADVDFQQVRRLGRYRYMLVNVAAEWCTGCRVEAQLLPDRFRDWDTRGGYVFSIIIEDTVTNPATQRNLERWLSTYPINYTMVHDPSGHINGRFAPPGLPLNVIVDLDTMEVLTQKVGEDLTFLDLFDSLLE